jgi:Bacterial membrane protein YfhO
MTEGIYNNSYLKPKAWNLFEHPVPYVRVLQDEAHLTRVLPFGVPAANVNEAFGIFSLSSLMAFNPPRVYELYREHAAAPAEVFLRDPSRIPPEPVLDRANVSFVGMYTAAADLMREARNRRYESRFTDGFFTLFRRSTRPRFLFSSEYQVLPRSEALKAIATVPTQTIILEEHPGFESTSNAPGDPHVRVESYRRNAVTVAVDAPRPGLLYASESFFDGWTATVNGQPSRILPADYAFRAVVVPPGPSRVEFHYWPPGLTLGLMISGGSVVVLAGLVIRPSAGSVTQGSPGSTPPRPS